MTTHICVCVCALIWRQNTFFLIIIKFYLYTYECIKKQLINLVCVCVCSCFAINYWLNFISFILAANLTLNKNLRDNYNVKVNSFDTNSNAFNNNNNFHNNINNNNLKMMSTFTGGAINSSISSPTGFQQRQQRLDESLYNEQVSNASPAPTRYNPNPSTGKSKPNKVKKATASFNNNNNGENNNHSAEFRQKSQSKSGQSNKR